VKPLRRDAVPRRRCGSADDAVAYRYAVSPLAATLCRLPTTICRTGGKSLSPRSAFRRTAGKLVSPAGKSFSPGSIVRRTEGKSLSPGSAFRRTAGKSISLAGKSFSPGSTVRRTEGKSLSPRSAFRRTEGKPVSLAGKSLSPGTTVRRTEGKSLSLGSATRRRRTTRRLPGTAVRLPRRRSKFWCGRALRVYRSRLTAAVMIGSKR
jgi:hypothetical protein